MRKRDEAIQNIAECCFMVDSMKRNDKSFRCPEGAFLLETCENILAPLRTRLRKREISPEEANRLADGVDLALAEYHCTTNIREGVETRNPSQVIFYMDRLRRTRDEIGDSRSEIIPRLGPVWDSSATMEEQLHIAEAWAKGEGIWTKK